MNRFRLNKYLSLSLLLAVLFSSPGDNLFRLKSRQTSINYSNSIELINEVNSLRISNGLPAYQINQTLMLIAQNHSDYQASISSITHYGPDGSRPFQRALAAGYPVAGDLSLGGYFSENIVAGRGLSASDAVNS